MPWDGLHVMINFQGELPTFRMPSSQLDAKGETAMRVALSLLLMAAGALFVHAGYAAPFDELDVDKLPSLESLGLKLPADAAEGKTPDEDDDVATPPPQGTDAAVIRTHLQAAQKAFAAGDANACLGHLSAAHCLNPRLGSPKLILARLHLDNNQLAAGRGLLEQLAVAEPDNPDVYLVFGNFAVAEGRWSDAMLNYQQALRVEIPPTWPKAEVARLQAAALAGQAGVSEQRGDWPGAEAALQKWVRMQPLDAQLRDRWGTALFRLGQHAQAYEQFAISFRQNPALSPPEVSMAVMYVQRGNFQQGERWFEKALAARPNSAAVHYELAGALLMEDKPTQARTHSQKAMELGMKTPAIAMQLGLISRQLKEFAEAERYFTRLHESGVAAAGDQLALVLIEQLQSHKREQALLVAQALHRQRPRSPQTLGTLAWIYYQHGRFDDAERHARAAIAAGANDPQTLYFAAKILHRQGHEDEAQRLGNRLADQMAEPGIFILRPEARRWLEELQ